jgi:hypothetical protein
MQEIPLFNMIVFTIATLWWLMNGSIWKLYSDAGQDKHILWGMGIAIVTFIFAAIICYDSAMSFRYNYDVTAWQFIYLAATLFIGGLSFFLGQWLVQKTSKWRFRCYQYL